MEDLTHNFIDTNEAGKILGVHLDTVARLIREGRLPAKQIAQRWVLPRSDVEEFAKTYEGKVGRPRKKRKYTRRTTL